MEQFSLEKWLKDKSRKVCTRDGRPVRILDYNLKGDKWSLMKTVLMICIAVDDKTQESITAVDEDGHCLIDKTGWHESNFDLFFADEEEKPQSIEIPFGAKDSEFVRDEYYIPEDCEARIEGNKVIIERVQKEEELTEFEKALDVFAHNSKLEASNPNYYDWLLKSTALNLLDLARKEILEEFRRREELFYKNGFERGRESILKDLPKWKKITQREQNYLLNGYLSNGEYYLSIQELKDKLPKEE